MQTLKKRNPMYFLDINIPKHKHNYATIDEIGDTISHPRGRSLMTARAFLLKALLESFEGEKNVGLEVPVTMRRT